VTHEEVDKAVLAATSCLTHPYLSLDRSTVSHTAIYATAAASVKPLRTQNARGQELSPGVDVDRIGDLVG